MGIAPSALSQTPGAHRQLTEKEQELFAATVENLGSKFSSETTAYKKIISTFFGIFLGTILAIFSFAGIIPILYADRSGGFGSHLFEAARTVDLYPVVYLDGFGGFEFALWGAWAGFIFSLFFWLITLRPALAVWVWRQSEKSSRDQQLAISVREAITIGRLNATGGYSLEDAVVAVYQRYARGAQLQLR